MKKDGFLEIIWLITTKNTPSSSDENDIEMLKMCGIGVAVDNAISDVKDIADSVTLSNDEDGVAEWLEKNVLMSMEQ